MTEEQVREFWENQQIIQPSDIIVEHGVPFIMPAKMNEIIDRYHFTGYSKNWLYPLYEVGSKVMEVEYNLSRQQRRDSSVAPVNIVYRYFAEQVFKFDEPTKSNPVFLAWEIDKFFHNAKQSVILDGLIQAEKEGIIEDYHLIENAYRECQEIKSKVNLKAIPEDRHLDTLLELHKTGTSFPQLVQLVCHSGLSSDVVKKLRRDLRERECQEEYAKLRPELKELADNSPLRGIDFVRELQKRYKDYDMKRIVSNLKSVADERRVREISAFYIELCPDDVYRHIKRILNQFKEKQIDASETVFKFLGLGYHPLDIWKTIKVIQNEGFDLDYDEIHQAFVKNYTKSQFLTSNIDMLTNPYKKGYPVSVIIQKRREEGYPDDILLEIVNYMKSNGIEFPYEEFYKIIVKKDVSKNVEQEEQVEEVQNQVSTAVAAQETASGQSSSSENSEEQAETALIIPEAQPEVISENAELQPAPSLENSNSSPETNLVNTNPDPETVKRRRIIQVRRAKSGIERRAIVSLAVATAGAVSSAVLINLFGVNPLVAARNCYASITAGNATLAQLLPAGKELISIFASVGTTIAGTIMYLRNDAKLRRLERREEMRR